MHSLSSITEPGGLVPGLEYRFNFGPSQKTRSMSLSVTMLGNPDISIAWPQRERVGLIFEGEASPLVVIETLLEKEGFRSPEELKHQLEIPKAQMTCCNLGRDICGETEGLVKAETGDPRTVLRHALILGLCGPTFYDPHKAVIWTNNRLSRTLELFEPVRWYENN